MKEENNIFHLRDLSISLTLIYCNVYPPNKFLAKICVFRPKNTPNLQPLSYNKFIVFTVFDGYSEKSVQMIRIVW